jgi:RNase adapter protein RapZ
VQEYVLSHDTSQQFIERTRDLLEVLVPGYQAEGRHYLTVAIGCTGGRHRSVVLAERVAALIREHELSVRVIHRDVERDAVPS